MARECLGDASDCPSRSLEGPIHTNEGEKQELLWWAVEGVRGSKTHMRPANPPEGRAVGKAPGTLGRPQPLTWVGEGPASLRAQWGPSSQTRAPRQHWGSQNPGILEGRCGTNRREQGATCVVGGKSEGSRESPSCWELWWWLRELTSGARWPGSNVHPRTGHPPSPGTRARTGSTVYQTGERFSLGDSDSLGSESTKPERATLWSGLGHQPSTTRRLQPPLECVDIIRTTPPLQEAASLSAGLQAVDGPGQAQP